MDITQPVARTAFYCCLIRADDAKSATPLCGDGFASRFLDDSIRRDLAPLLEFKRPAASNVARHRLIDDIAREHLAKHPSGRVVLLGAGFDTRAYRLSGGRWFELDDPSLLAFKEARLPAADAPNPLTRIPVTFGTTRPDQFLSPLAGDDDVLVILEGVTMYLSDAALQDLAGALVRAFPRLTLVCDLMTPFFAQTYSRGLRQALLAMGAQFGERTGHPRHAFEAAGLVAAPPRSIPLRAMEAQAISLPPLIMSTLLRTLRDGYMVWVFRLHTASR